MPDSCYEHDSRGKAYNNKKEVVVDCGKGIAEAAGGVGTGIWYSECALLKRMRSISAAGCSANNTSSLLAW